jgi:hypothetical protein
MKPHGARIEPFSLSSPLDRKSLLPGMGGEAQPFWEDTDVLTDMTQG